MKPLQIKLKLNENKIKELIINFSLCCENVLMNPKINCTTILNYKIHY